MKYKRSSRLGHTGVSFQEGGTFKSFESFSFASDFRHKPLGKERERGRKKNEKQTLGKEERERWRGLKLGFICPGGGGEGEGGGGFQFNTL